MVRRSSPGSLPPRTSRPSTCTATWPRTPVSGISRRSPRARSASWSPPTSPPAASTSMGSTWLSTRIHPPSTRYTCTGRGGRPARVRPAWWSLCKPLVTPAEAALLQHRDHRQGRRGTLVAIAASGAEAVGAAAGSLVQHRNPGIVVAQEPRHAQVHAGEPGPVTGDGRRAHARVGQRGDLDRLLVEARARLARPPSSGRHHGQVAAAGLDQQEPVEHPQAGVEERVTAQFPAGQDDRLGDRRVRVAEPWGWPRPRRVPGWLTDDRAGLVQQPERTGMTGPVL